MNWKSERPVPVRIGIWPLFTRWALTMIMLSLDWRNISLSRTTGTTSESMISLSTLPAPTEGSWSTSPTRIRVACSGIALSRWYMRIVSIMEASSMTKASASSGFCSSFLNRPSLGLNSRRRCMVRASRPVASLILRAALPVGAASITLWPMRSWIAMIDLMMVVFPVPGPPVMTMTFRSTESLTARACWLGKGKAELPFRGRKEGVSVHQGQLPRMGEKVPEAARDPLLGHVEPHR